MGNEIYVKSTLNEVFSIKEIITVHYFEYSANFAFYGEAHDFWEFLYVDKGTVEVTAADASLSLEKDQIIFHQPNEFHNVKANGMIAPNLVVIAFACDNPAMKSFENKITKVNSRMKGIISEIVNESKAAFSTKINDPFVKEMKKREEALFGSEQMIKILMEQFMILLFRQENLLSFWDLSENISRNVLAGLELEEDVVFREMLAYLQENIDHHLNLEEICQAKLISRSRLQKMFKQKTGGGVIQFHTQMRIEYAKELIRKGDKNFTEISQHLGYNSLHYFSKQFKLITGMNPSEYADSIL